ncbi:conserved hypothetical protein [Leishmania mexicana MHOM/GT/2001/U1103]|uniref:Uncharacterized protein n=1 Tax=Leishmania mexicana (strain MHOM/GT/2001/U1103) TaxID=929439 RepID=E9ARM2_LEIMU|nr:conserved hypothetical protein [Leishmania mexicana MHOM/GT/2001/U1103]CBZ25593.1 conserved hypothetical protein [Leishmania mexicana MHOM/GT/2001/U1103]
MRRTDPSSVLCGTGSGTAVVQGDEAFAGVFQDDPATPAVPATPAAADMPVASPSSSILYTLLQDLGLTATAQALCEELQRQQSHTVTLSPPSAPSLPSQASEVFVSLPHGNGATSPNTLGASLLPQHTEDVSPTRKTQAPASASVEPLPASVAMSSTATAAQRSNRVSASSDPAGDVSVELQRKVQPYCHVSQCTRAVASLAACAAEPLLALSPAFPSPPLSASASAATIATPLQLVDTLTTLWRAELRAALPHRAGSGMADAAAEAGAQSHRDGAFQVAALIARAAWCELRITELVFMQELHLAHTSAAATAPSAAAQPLQEAQRELVEVAGQLVTALQELRATCSAAVAQQCGVSAPPSGPSDAPPTHVGLVIASSIVSRLHSKSIGWLRNAECVMAWVLRRHGAFEPSADTAQASSSAQQQQQRKRRCLEAHSTATSAERSSDSACNSVPSPLLQPLQDIILGLSTATSAPAPSYQQCLDAEIARSAAALAKSGVARQTDPTPAAVDHDACGLFASVRIPITVRVAMTVQRVKLLHTLVGALVYNGDDSILCTLVVFAADRIRPWWTRQSSMLAQFLVQCAHQLSNILTSFLVQSSAGAQATPPQRSRLLSAASETVVLSLREQLEALAKEVLLCACPVANIALPVPQDSRLALCVRLMNALQQAHDTRSARLDRYVLKTCTAAAANTAMSANLVFSPLSSASSPTFESEGSPVTSPVWTVRVPSPPGLDLRGAAEQPTSSTPVHRSSIASDTSSTFDSMEAARTAAQVLQWKPHFIQLLATIATGRWQAQQDAPQAPYPGSRYHRLRLRMRDALRHAQELLRLQPRLQIGARGVVYPPHPTAGSDPDAGVPLSVVEQMPRMLQLATLQDARVLQRRLERRLTRETKYDGHNAAPTETSTSIGSSGDAAAAPVASSMRRGGVSPPSVSQPRTTGLKVNVGTSEYRSATSALAAATSTALRRPHITTEAEEPVATHRVASGNEGHPATSGSARPLEGQRATNVRSPGASTSPTPEPAAVGEDQESSQRLPVPSEVMPSGSEISSPDEEAGSSASDVAAAAVAASSEPQWENDEEQDEEEDTAEDPQLDRWHLHDEEAQDEIEEVDEEDEEEDAEEVGSQASSADMDYDRAEDDMKEEVECVEATPDGRLLALLTARGRLMVLRLQPHDSTSHYEEEVLIDASLPSMPSREKRLQWFESLSSFAHFSPCHRFVLAAVQFAPVELKPNSTCAMARAQSGSAGQLNIYSLHREDDGDETGSDSRDLEQEDQSSASPAISGIRERLRRLVGPATDRLYATFRPHDGPCLSARWVDTRWWGGGRRSRWANSAVEPLNSTNAAATVLMQCVKMGEVAGKSVGVLPSAKGATSEHRAVPKSWRAAAGVLLSEYQCVSVGMDDLILRWLPACGVVLQRVLTEPVQDIIVSPLMAAFYVANDSGDLYMYDAWDERNVTDGHPCSASEDADPCSMYSKSLSTVQTHRLVLPVTEEGHPRFHRVGRTLQHHQPYGHSSVSVSPSSRPSQQPQQQDRSLHHETLDDSDIIDQVHSNRSSAHYTGPVTPVFQRVVDPSRGLSGLPQHAPFHTHHPSFSDNTAAAQEGFSDDDENDGAQGDEAAPSRLAGRSAQGSSHRRSSGQAKTGTGSVGWTGLPRHLCWLLPHHWAPHTPWDAQLGRRIIRNLLRQTHTTTPTDTGELFYERNEETAGVAAALAVASDEANQPSLTDEQGSPGDAHRGRRPGHLYGGSGDAEGDAHDREEATCGSGGGQQDASSDEDGSRDSAEREYVYTTGADYDDDDDGARRPLPSHIIYGGGSSHVASEATAAAAAAAKGVPVSVLECAAHPTPARGPLQRAYYPSGACLVYKSVAKALCNAGDLADRQTQSEMGPGGSTHHLLSMAFSGEPQWMSEQRLWEREAEEAGATQTWQRTPHPSGSAADYDYGDAHDGSPLQQRDGGAGADTFSRPSAPLTLWSTAALARVLLWKDYFRSSRHLAGPKAEKWAEWESDVLATTYHADVLPPSYTRQAGSSREPRWSAAELLATRGYLGPRDAWRRCAPASQRGLAATARNGRYLCIMASVGPYRKLVNPREPLRDMAGFYACAVFDVYAGAVLRVIPVCPTDLSGLRGRCMWTSERHESDPKAPIYRLPCAVTVVPLPASSATMAAAGKGASGSPTGLPSNRSVTAALCDEGVVGDEEDGEPAEVVMLTVGGLGNCIYVFDALSGRRLVCEAETTRHCGESAAAAYEATARVAKARAKARGARSGSVRSDSIPVMPHIPATSAAAPTVPSAPPTLSVTVTSPILPASIRKPVDVLASVAAWGRGTGFDGITDPSSSTAPSPGPSPICGIDGGMGEDSSIDVQPVHSAPEAQAAAAAALAVSEAVAQTGAPVPWLLQGTTFSQLGGWHLRGILWWVHENPQPSTLYRGDDGGAVVEQDARWSQGNASWGEAGTRANGGGMNGNGDTRPAAALSRGDATNGGAANNVAAPPLSSAPHMSAASSALSFFYQTLLGVSGMTGSGAAPPPTDASATSSQLHSRQQHAAGSSSSTLSVAYPSYGSVWRQRRHRLLERLLRHYDVGMLWQAYVTLFSAATTATSSLAPQSAVCALVQWALSTDKAATAAAALLGSSDSHTRWIWCVTHASRASSKGPSASSKQLRLSGNTGKHATTRSRDVEHVDVGSGGASGGAGDRSTVPFAHILQQREDFMIELQALDTQQQQQQQQATAGAAEASPTRSIVSGHAKSLLFGVRAQAMAEGMLPITAKGRAAQQQQRSAAAAHELSSSAAIKLPPSHHQNQLHVDVVNCVASWFDANGGFYVCCGSEDGGLYIMGGHIMD